MTAVAQPGGVIDVHAHWLPRSLFGLPPGAPYGPMHDRDGQLFLGDLPLSIATESMSDEAAIIEDMDRAGGVAVRVLSAPPFAFPLSGEPGGADYARAFNTALADVVSRTDGKLLGLGVVSLGASEEITAQLTVLRDTAGIVGVAIPPVVAGESLHRARCGTSSSRLRAWTLPYWSIPCRSGVRSGRTTTWPISSAILSKPPPRSRIWS